MTTAPTSSRAPARPARNSAPPNAIDFNQKDEIMTVEVGNIILATGYDLFDARRVPQLRLWTPGERLHQPGVRTPEQRGRPDRRQHRPARWQDHARSRWASSTAWARRDKNYNNYCSVICCMQSLKFAHLVHERTGATVYNFYIDMRTACQGLRRVLPARPGRRHAVRARQGGRGHGCRPHCRAKKAS